MTISPSRTTGAAPVQDSSSIGGPRPADPGDPTGSARQATWGNFSRHFWGVSSRHLQAPVVVVDGAGNVSFNHMDRLGSVVGTSAGGSPVATYGYTPYGASTTGLSGTAFGYAGYRWDGETNLYHTQTRSYDPAMGRFIQTDPIGYAGGRNLYAYTGGDPLNNTDPQGTCCDDIVAEDPSSSGGGLIGGDPLGDNPTEGIEVITEANLQGFNNDADGIINGKATTYTTTVTQSLSPDTSSESETVASTQHTINFGAGAPDPSLSIGGGRAGSGSGEAAPPAPKAAAPAPAPATAPMPMPMPMAPAAPPDATPTSNDGDPIVGSPDIGPAASGLIPVVSVPVISGIYEFVSASGRLYVGQSVNIPSRINQHIASGNLLPQDVGTVQITQIPGGKTAREIERAVKDKSVGWNTEPAKHSQSDRD